MEKEKSVVFQTFMSYIHIGLIVFIPHMLEHADGDDMIETLPQIAVVLQPEFDRQAPAEFPAEGQLLLRDLYPCDLHLIFFRGVPGEAAPAAADVQYLLPWLQAELPAGQVQLGLLGLIQTGRVLPVSAAVNHPPVQHMPEELIADIIMSFTDLKGPCPGADIAQHRTEGMQEQPPVLFKPVFRLRRHDPGEKPVEVVAFPVAVHIRLPKAQTAFADYPPEKGFVPYADVPGVAAVNGYTRRGKYILDKIPEPVFSHKSS